MFSQELRNNFYQPEANLLSLQKKLRAILEGEKISNKQVFEAIADGFASLQVYNDVRRGLDVVPSLPRFDVGEEIQMSDSRFDKTFFVYERTPKEESIKREERVWIQYGDPVVFIHRNKYGKLYVSRNEHISDTSRGMYGKRYDLTNQDRIDIVEIVYKGVLAPDFQINPGLYEGEHYEDE